MRCRSNKSHNLILSLIMIIGLTLAFIPAAGFLLASQSGQINAYASSNKIEIISGQTVYVQSGGKNIVSIRVKNNTTFTIKGVNFADGFGSAEDYSKFANDKPYNYTDGSSKRTTTDPVYHDENEWYRFGPYFEEDGYKAVNATWDSDEEGYTIAAGATATLWFQVNSEDEDTGAYTEWIKLGNTHTEWLGGFLPITIIDEVYSGEMNVNVVTYNPTGAALVHGTSSNYGQGISYVNPGSTINIGTIDVSNNSDLSGDRYYYTRNKTTISDTGKDEHGNSQNIQVSFVLDSSTSYTADEGLISSLLSYIPSSTNNNLPPDSDVKVPKETKISYDATNFVAGTYNATLIMRTTPHNVKVNAKDGNNNGVYSWPVSITLTGTNPRIPKAPTSLTATPGNGQVQLTWKAASDAEEGTEYFVWRRDGIENNSANRNNASFDWSNYSRVGSDSPDEEGDYLFIDGSVENGKTYTYVVTGGEPLQAYPALSDTVKPLKTYNNKIMAPDRLSVDSLNGGVMLSWRMNDAYGGSDNDGSSMVDHFNVYRDDVLVSQVYQNAVIEDNDYEGGEIISTSYSWDCHVTTPIAYQTYSFAVAAVSKSGVVGYMSDPEPGQGLDDDSCLITGHNAIVRNNWSETPPTNEIDLRTATTSEINKVEYWRCEGTSAPDTSKTPYYSKSDDQYSFKLGFTDERIQAGKTYTYTARVTNGDGVKSDPYTFSVAVPTGSGWEEEPYSSADVNWSISSDGKKAHLTWSADWANDSEGNYSCRGTYKVYRNGSVIKTLTASQDNNYFDITNDPGIDGSYVYRVDKIYNGITIKGREYSFERNTAKVNEDKLLKVPGTPTFDVRVSNGVPVLRWAASDKGGAVEGYHIYRKDAGQYNNNQFYYESTNGWSDGDRFWPNKRYITITNAKTDILVDTEGEYLGDRTKGYLDRVDWNEESCPHEYWITAYNQAGESKPSKVVSFEFQGTPGDDTSDPPVSSASFKPGTPVIEDAWVDWNDNSGADWATDINGKIRVAWSDPSSSEPITDKWDFSYTNIRYNDSDTVYAWQVASDPRIKKGTSKNSPGGSVDADSGSNGDYGRTAKITVTAKNSAGSTTSAEKTLVIRSLPRFKAYAGNNYALLKWTKLFKDTSINVNSWEIWRKRESGNWQIIKTLKASSLEYDKDSSGNYITDSNGTKNYSYKDTSAVNGWSYEYKIIAKCSDGNDRSSVVRTVKPMSNASSEAPSAPQNLKCNVLNGEFVFSWDPPKTGTANYYKLVEVDGNNFYEYSYIHAPSTSIVNTQSSPGTYSFFVYAYTYIDGNLVPKTNGYSDDIDEAYPNHSNVVDIELTEDQINQQAEDGPDEFSLTATSSENQVNLSWTASKGATYYELIRYEVNGDDTVGPIALPYNATSYTDYDAMPGVLYHYKLYAHNSYGDIYDEAFASATGTSKDQIIAEETAGLIEALPTASQITVTNYLTHKPNVENANDSYNALSTKQKKLIKESLRNKLEGCVNKIEEIEINNEYAAQIAPVQAKIDALPSEASLADKAKVESARSDYEALPSKAKKLVDTTKLINAENRIAKLEKEAADTAVVNKLIQDLNDLTCIDDVNESNANGLIDETESLYNRINALDADQRLIFDNAEGSSDLLVKLAETEARAKYLFGINHDHVPAFTEEVDATCSEPGHIACYICKACGKYFSDLQCTKEIAKNEAEIPVDYSKHDWSKWEVTTPATCQSEGVESRVCGNNDTHIETRTIGLTGHKWKSEPELGSTETNLIYKCENCDTTRTVEISVGAGSQCEGNHNWDWDNPKEVVPPTCCENGYTRYRCKNAGCEDTVMEVQEIDPSAHGWNDDSWVVESQATCTEPGVKARVCSHNSSHREELTIDPIGHDWGTGKIISKPTCTDTGERVYTCSKCGETKSEIIPADANAHDWEDWITIKEPSCTEEGLSRRVCLNDSAHQQTKAIPMVVHSWDGGSVSRQPNVGVTGIKTYTCTVCGATRQETLAALVQPEIQDLPAVKISKPTAGKKKVTVKWKKPSKKNIKKIQGVEVRIIGNGIDKTYKVSKKKTSKKVSKLKSKKKYKVMVRAYKIKGNVKHVSAWKSKTVKIK